MHLENENSHSHLSQVLQNLVTAQDVLSAAPEDKIHLSSFGTRTECRTLYCALGWLATTDEFKDQMVLVWFHEFFHKGEKMHTATLTSPTGDGYLGEWLNELFGPQAYSLLFIYAGGSPFDINVVARNPGHTHKTMALNRFRQRILQVRQRLQALEAIA